MSTANSFHHCEPIRRPSKLFQLVPAEQAGKDASSCIQLARAAAVHELRKSGLVQIPRTLLLNSLR
jgi:hypothetical protein